ncbi:MAG: PilZ domain-containing protein [Nitrospiraceae bacterium]
MNPRKSPRFVVELPVSFTGDYGGAGMVTNLSIGGCDIDRADVAMEVNAMLTLHLYLSSWDAPIQVDAARVSWTMGNKFGLEFLSIEEKEHERLHRYIASVSSSRRNMVEQFPFSRRSHDYPKTSAVCRAVSGRVSA